MPSPAKSGSLTDTPSPSKKNRLCIKEVTYPQPKAKIKRIIPTFQFMVSLPPLAGIFTIFHCHHCPPIGNAHQCIADLWALPILNNGNLWTIILPPRPERQEPRPLRPAPATSSCRSFQFLICGRFCRQRPHAPVGTNIMPKSGMSVKSRQPHLTFCAKYAQIMSSLPRAQPCGRAYAVQMQRGSSR